MNIQNDQNDTVSADVTQTETISRQSEDTGIICPKCGKENLSDSEFCRFCGSSMKAVAQQTAPQTNGTDVICPNCGKQVSSLSRFCKFCGGPISVNTAAAFNPSNAYPNQQSTMNAYQYQQNNAVSAGGYGQYQPQQFPAYNNQPNYMAANPFLSSAPPVLDPRYDQFKTSMLQPGQREIVRCMQVSKTYGTNNALNSVDLVIGNGRVIGLLGPNGSGKTTLIKLLCGLLTPTTGSITINGCPIGAATKAMVSYLPDRTYIPDWMKISNILDYFTDFYADFRRPIAEQMLNNLHIDPNAVMKTLSKGTQEKVQLVLVMSRNASLYLLDEPIAGVDPVARDYILDTIIRTHNPDSSVVISTHLITDIEPVLNEVIMIKYGTLALHGDADQLRNTFGKSLNDIFKEVFAGC